MYVASEGYGRRSHELDHFDIVAESVGKVVVLGDFPEADVRVVHDDGLGPPENTLRKQLEAVGVGLHAAVCAPSVHAVRPRKEIIRRAVDNPRPPSPERLVIPTGAGGGGLAGAGEAPKDVGVLGHRKGGESSSGARNRT